ncbi:diguanylate cyclase/phosphodiesterase (GGDEF & EAL domains) with PAS/PAC sensor [Collimonas arenae]|uniref:Virulence sensor protein BvgS n=2 Tax=Collimonas arenae TaxID=279058 RepID=A0A0A1FER3_9BURK|nr:diguanylate cyclase/phosphodiesterase (GGDEF & EAL domains) with PAS/PAC sensor [Collimonas arenae]
MAIVTVSILGLALFSSLMNSWETSQRMRGYLIEQGLHIAENLARQSTLALLYHSSDNVRDQVATSLAFPDVLRVDITDATHNILLSQTKKGAHIKSSQVPRPDISMTQSTLEQETGDEWRFGAPVYQGREAVSPFELQENKVQLLGYVHIVLGKETMNRLVLSLLVVNLIITFSFALVLLGIMRLLARHLIRPLNALSELMGRAEAGESGMRAGLDGPRDIIDMAHAFNKMMTVLEEREAELKKSRDQAVYAALMKAKFAATVSHEVRTPLNGVVGMLDILKEMRLTKSQLEYVEVAWNSAHTLVDLINDILDFSKMEANKLVLEEIDFDLGKLTEEVLELLAKQAQQKGLEFGYLLASDVPDWIKGDSMRLRQVLINLVSNALKFTEQGEVAVNISRTTDSDDCFSLRIEVSDTGIGMNQDAVQHVFESFTQADSTTARKYGGTGLGLAICKQLVELMGGEIGVVSQPGEGTTFWFTIRCQPSEIQTVVHPDKVFLGMHVLVIQESNVLRSFLAQNLARYGMLCQVVSNGSEALEELGRTQKIPYSIIIMDRGTTDGNGVDLALQIRSNQRLSTARFFLLDRYGLQNSVKFFGADVYLSKPIRLSALLSGIRDLMSGQELDTIPAPAPSLSGDDLTAAGKYQVLVVEDNRTNQMVAAGMLAMSGCHCEFAANGWGAIEIIQRNKFDLILMDCNMPGMDGYEVTARIRDLEKAEGRHTPIVAMTANTQAGDAEKCLAAGMDDYLAKPITLIELRYKLERWLMHDSTHTENEHLALSASVQTESEDVALDRSVFDKLRDILGESLQQAVTPYLEDTPVYLEQLENAVSQKDAECARALAHTIKGSSGNLGATNVTQFAKEVEELALNQQIDEIRPLLPKLNAAFDEVVTLLGNEAFIGSQKNVVSVTGNALVLVVDDDRSTRNALRYTLLRDGFRVAEAENGGQALHILKRMQPDVILMDAVMPVMDGFTACARIHELPNGRNIPVLMITGLDDNISVERAFTAGASDYITKPIHFTVLSQRVRRIIEASRAEKRVRDLAFKDSLTGLPNRAMFFEQLKQCIEHAGQAENAVAVLFLDLNRFKYVNDTLGHDVGDQLLVAVARRIRRSVRAVDCVARLGGDEFTVVLVDMISADTATIVAQAICRSLSSPFLIEGHGIFVSASIGISLYPTDGTDVGTLLQHADTAMYRAKKANSGFKFFEPSMERLMSERMRLESDLRMALDRKELEVYYQPQVQFDTGRIVGMEALVRWRHPTRGMVEPKEFIPLAEETDLINIIGEWVMRTACAQLQSWINSGLPAMRMAVNFSVRQLQADFVAQIERVLAETGLSPHLLELEITEGTLMENAEDNLHALHQLRNLGVRLTIDDFGTGYSSLAYLKRFHVDIIKIDQSFVQDVPNDLDDSAIVKSIIALAHSLRLEVVAEGVENVSQLDFLRDHSCDMMQGYYFSQPIPTEQVADFIKEQAYLRMPGFSYLERDSKAD